MRLDLTPEDILRLKALGVAANADNSATISQDEQNNIAWEEAITTAKASERRAWQEARRWRLFGYLGLLCAAASIVAQLLAMAARKGGW